MFAQRHTRRKQLRTAIGMCGAAQSEGMELKILDAQKEGMTQPLLAAVLT